MTISQRCDPEAAADRQGNEAFANCERATFGPRDFDALYGANKLALSFPGTRKPMNLQTEKALDRIVGIPLLMLLKLIVLAAG